MHGRYIQKSFRRLVESVDPRRWGSTSPTETDAFYRFASPCIFCPSFILYQSSTNHLPPMHFPHGHGCPLDTQPQPRPLIPNPLIRKLYTRRPKRANAQDMRQQTRNAHPTPNTQHTTPNTQHPTPNTQHTTHNTQHTTHNTCKTNARMKNLRTDAHKRTI